jgi:hypothetical protein
MVRSMLGKQRRISACSTQRWRAPRSQESCRLTRTYAGMLSRGSWISLPASLSSVLTDVDGRGTDLGVFLAAADLLVLRDGAALVLVLPPEHSWPSEGDRQEALRRGDRLSLPRLQLVPRANCLNWELPVS